MKNTKEKILAAASQLFLSGGLSALSVRAIAREANLSTIGIYSYFEGKQGILDALYIEGFELVLAASQVSIDLKHPKLGVMAAAKGYIQTAQLYRGHYRLIFGESDSGYIPSELAQEAAKKAFIKITNVVATLLPDDANYESRREAAIQIWALVHGYIGLQHHAIGDVIEPDSWEKMILDAVSLHIDALLLKYK